MRCTLGRLTVLLTLAPLSGGPWVDSAHARWSGAAEFTSRWRMCGRYVRFRQWVDLRGTLTLLSRTVELPPSYNVAPTQQVLVARERDGKQELDRPP